MKELREHNENMLRNILPSHVARHFLEKDRDNEVSPRHGDTPRIRSWFTASQLVSLHLTVNAATAALSANH